jgi:hypothetical protein
MSRDLNQETEQVPAEGPVKPVQVKRVRRRRRRRTYRKWAARAAAVAIILGSLVTLASIPASRARSQLLQGKALLEQGQHELLAGAPEKSEALFADAEASFIKASSAARNPLLRVFGWIPVVGRTPDAVVGIAGAGELVAQAGQKLAQALTDLPGGLEALAPKGGALPTAGLTALVPAVHAAKMLTDSALVTLRQTSRSLLLGSVGQARDQAETQLESLGETLATAEVVIDRLPSFLGQQGPKRYFFGAQNPAELRGTGGVIGAYSILTIDRGRFRFSDFHEITLLPEFSPRQVPAPNPSYAHNYNRFGGAGVWRNVNLTPDFPSAAQAIESAYRRAKGVSLDGVVVADPFTLADLLRVTGPVAVPSEGIQVSADNVVAYTTNLAYRSLVNQIQRKLILGEAAKNVFAKLMGGAGSPAAVARALAGAVADGHLLVYSNDQVLQQGLVQREVAGAFAANTGDFVSVVQNNAGANKADFFEDRSVTYSVQLNPDGSANAITTVTLKNGAPTSGQPQEVIGPIPGGSRAGENVSYLNLYCAPSCSLDGAELNGVSEPLHSDEELGFPYFQDFLRIPSGHSAQLRYELSIDRAWQGDRYGGIYRITCLNQATIKPTTMRLEVRIPRGMSIIETSLPMKVSGGLAVWEGTPRRVLELEVRFQRPLLQRVWGRVWRFLSKPVIRF